MQENRRAIGAWCLYDWANSAFTTLVVSFIYSAYFTQAIAPDEITGTAWWSRAVTVSALLVAMLSPWLGGLADRTQQRKRFLAMTTLTCVLGTAGLAFVAPDMPSAALIALTLFVVANVGFELGMVLYNSFLPSLAPERIIGRISGYGWALGYAGGLGCLVLALIGFVQPEIPWFGISKQGGANIRATSLLTAVWFAVFCLPFFFFVREPAPAESVATEPEEALDLRAVFRELLSYPETVKFLIARLVFNDGLVTIFAFGGIYAAGTFGMSFEEIIVFGIALNVAAGLGAFAFGFLDDRIGGKRTIAISLVALGAATALATFAPDRRWFWVAAITLGIFAGPNQAASRSLMARFVPRARQAEFFGFFAFSGKLTAFLGPLLLGIVTEATGSQRAGIGALLVFFVVGGALLTTVDEKRGIEAAQRSS